MESFLPIQQLDEQQRNFLEVLYQETIVLDEQKMDDLWRDLDAKLFDCSAGDWYDYRYDYARWYTETTWNRLNLLSHDAFVSLMPRIIIPALLLGFDVWRDFIFYFGTSCHYAEDISRVYVKVKRAVFDAETIIHARAEEAVTMREIVARIQRLNDRGNDSLEMAELQRGLREYIAPSKEREKWQRYYVQDPEDVVQRFVDLIHFFLGIDEESIVTVVDSYFHPDLYVGNVTLVGRSEDKRAQIKQQREKRAEEEVEGGGKREKQQHNESRNTAQKEDVKKISEKKLKNDASKSDRTPSQKSVISQDGQKQGDEKQINQPKKQPSNQPTTYQNVKKMLEQGFDVDESGQFSDVAGALRYLDTLAERYTDPKIKELYYFDEEAGQFVWNDDLLSQS